ncbi:hypothetical protein NCC49_005657 [Naganishia albida]|nr:hypothetical protein NCC49_005657 [Naganishia albida]
MAAGIAFPGFITTFIAFTLLLLNSISTPIFKQLYFLRVYLTDPGAAKLSPSALLLGTLGYCVSGDASSVFSPFHDGTNASGCTPAKVGYKLDYRLFVDGEVWGISMDGMSKVVVKGLTYLLFLQPFATAITFIALTFTFFAWSCSSRALEITSFIVTSIAAVVAWAAWIAAMALFMTAKRRIKDASDGKLSAAYGNCLWMGLAAALILTIAILLTFAGTFGSYSKKKNHKVQPHSHGPHQKHGLKSLVTLGKKGKHEAGHYEYVYQPTASTDGAAYPLIPAEQYQPAYRQTVWQG